MAKKAAEAAKVVAADKEAAASAKEAEAKEAAAAAQALKQAASTNHQTTFAGKAKQLKSSKSWLDNARKTKNSIPVVGQKEGGVLAGVAPFVRDYWDVFVSRLSDEATDEKVKRHLHEYGIEVRDVWMLKSKQKSTKSARVRVALEHKTKVKDDSMWPKFVKVQDWVRKPKSAV